MRECTPAAKASLQQQLQQQQQQQQQQQHANQNAPSAQQAALMQTIKSVVCSVLCILVLANIGIHYFVGPPPSAPLADPSPFSQPADAASKLGGALTSEDPTVCNIERRWAKNLSLDEFRTRYRLQRPVILQFENGASDWLQGVDAWTLDKLAGQLGSYEAMVGRPIDIVRAGGRGQERVNFGQFVRSIRNESACETRYIFSREFFHSTRLDSSLKFPPVMAYSPRDHDLFFFLGGNGSGVAFHRHADAWNAVIGGRKRWFLYPGDRAPPGGVHHAFEPRDWLARVYTRGHTAGELRASRPIQCVQVAGEILYIPEGYYHATINLEPTLAIGIQYVKPIGSLETLFYEMKGKSPVEVDAIASKALKTVPHNTELIHKQAISRRRQEKYQEAEKLLERVLSMDTKFLVAILDLAEIKWKYFSKTLEADALYKRALDLNPNLWEVHGKYGEFLAYQTGELERAVAALEQAARIRHNELLIYQLLRTIHDFAGNETAAAAAAEKIDQLSIIEDQLIDF